ncbi:cytochrome P450 4d2-like [Anopheles cruzii]|uniref:cytochrome P450 4d2-like n=1 Tax=Anopheles cruzii TaxID=68878 RepID=UPI0022EC17C5|nr:cytochrome P450 4d2-like [Anopheles cruzii]
MSVSSVVILLTSLLLLLLLYAVVKAYRKRQQLRKIAAHFGGAKPHWLLGNLLDYPKNDVPGIFDAMVQRHTDHGKDLFSWALLNDHMVIVSSAENVAKVVMAKQTQKSTFYQFLEVWLGQGLLLSWGDKWFQRRRIITPTFHFNILAAFSEVFNREATVLVEKLAPLANSGREFDIYEPVSLYALNSICLTSMGVDVNAQRDPTNQYVRDVKRMSELVLLRIFHVLSSFPQVYWYTMPHAWEQRKLIGRLHAFTDSVIHQRRQRLLNGDQAGRFDVSEENRYAKRKETFLDLLLNVTVDGRPLSDLDIREEVDTFMFEGHDTTASAIAFTFLQLAGHREIQDRLHREIVDTLGPDHRTVPLTYGTLQNFRYLDMVVKESLRLLPPVSFIGRRLVEDLQLNGVTVPAGTDCLIPIYVIHRNPNVYPDPERFDPERFADGSEQRRGPYDYMPFSVGARNCIGQRFAVLEIKISIIRMVSHYHIHPGDTIRGVRLKTDLVLRPDKGIPIKLSARPDRTE